MSKRSIAAALAYKGIKPIELNYINHSDCRGWFFELSESDWNKIDEKGEYFHHDYFQCSKDFHHWIDMLPNLRGESFNYRKGQYVVYKDVVGGVEPNTCFMPDHLFKVSKVIRHINYLEIRGGCKCYGTDGTDIRPATKEEIHKKHRLPRLISWNKSVVFLHSDQSNEILKIDSYFGHDQVSLKNQNGDLIESNIHSIREADQKEIDQQRRLFVCICIAPRRYEYYDGRCIECGGLACG